MPTSKRRKKPRRGPKRPGIGARSERPTIPPIDGLVRTVLRGGRELLDVEDPLEAEMWASSMLGTFYKLPLPLDARDELERSIGPAIVRGAERGANAEALAVLHAFAAVGGDDIRSPAREAAERLGEHGIPRPPWAAEIGTPEFVDAWTFADPYGDQRSYYATFRYSGREPHLVMALYDENLGGIIKDAFAGAVREDPRELAERDPDIDVEEADPGLMATGVLKAIDTGDLFWDNHWTDDFKQTRGLLHARMRLLPAAVLPEPQPPMGQKAREALTAEFLASPHAPEVDEAASIVAHCLDARCDFGDGDPLRWSPIVVELFMLDYLPRKASLDAGEIRALPDVLPGWVRFALAKRGLEERWIAPAEEAVGRFAPEFRRAVTDHSNFGPAKAIANAMLAAGVDLADQEAVDAWIADFNSRPIEERDEFLGALPLPTDLGR